jgi:hypothetical protein
MKIDRHNYEEYFILYMDNELGSDDRRTVEAFIENHPDLKEELDILLQYKLVPDTDIVFAHKEELMVPAAIGMTSNSFINLTNYEEWLVLYSDNELSAEQRTAVEHFVAANPSAKKELALIQRSKLQPEEIIFADKASLYRKEEKVRPMPVRWWRIAAAAVLLFGIGITAALVINNKSSVEDDTAKNTPTEKKTNTETPVANSEKINNPVNETVVADNTFKQKLSPEPKQPVNNAVTTVAVKEKDSKVNNKIPFNTPATIKKDEPVIVDNNNDKPSNNLPQPLNNPGFNKNDAANNAIASIDPSKEKNNSDGSLTKPPVTIPTTKTSDSNNTDATFASLEEGDSKNKKNRGFLRKVARTFEKRTSIDPTDDGKLLVAGLSFKLK